MSDTIEHVTSHTPDKKAGLTRLQRETRTQQVKAIAEKSTAPAPTPKDPTPFEPRERLGIDKPEDGEKWDAKRDRETREKAEANTVERRMSDIEQLGLDAGRCAEQVKSLRRELKFAESRVASAIQKLADAEAQFTMRMSELREVAQ